MREGRRGEAERLVQQDLTRRVRNVILAADHMRHPHQRIVHDDREVVRRVAVGADDHRIADDVGLKAHLAADEVGEGDVAILRHAKADRRPLAAGDARRRLLRRHAPARARILRRPAGGERLLSIGLELRGRAEAVVRRLAGKQLLRVRLIEMEPLRLTIRTVRPVDVGPLVPVEAEPSKIADDRRLRLARRTLEVGVFDPENEGAALPAR